MFNQAIEHNFTNYKAIVQMALKGRSFADTFQGVFQGHQITVVTGAHKSENANAALNNLLDTDTSYIYLIEGWKRGPVIEGINFSKRIAIDADIIDPIIAVFLPSLIKWFYQTQKGSEYSLDFICTVLMIEIYASYFNINPNNPELSIIFQKNEQQLMKMLDDYEAFKKAHSLDEIKQTHLDIMKGLVNVSNMFSFQRLCRFLEQVDNARPILAYCGYLHFPLFFLSSVPDEYILSKEEIDTLIEEQKIIDENIYSRWEKLNQSADNVS